MLQVHARKLNPPLLVGGIESQSRSMSVQYALAAGSISFGDILSSDMQSSMHVEIDKLKILL